MDSVTLGLTDGPQLSTGRISSRFIAQASLRVSSSSLMARTNRARSLRHYHNCKALARFTEVNLRDLEPGRPRRPDNLFPAFSRNQLRKNKKSIVTNVCCVFARHKMNEHEAQSVPVTPYLFMDCTARCLYPGLSRQRFAKRTVTCFRKCMTRTVITCGA